MARRRYQKGRVFLRGKKGREVWVGRWREDETKDGRIRRPERSEVPAMMSDPSRALSKDQAWKKVSEERGSPFEFFREPWRRDERPTITLASFRLF